ncbi:hypothetical protein M427DRAFT_37533 [Gonapodya prolifera JEL478]|uniref:Uncharacterized protein n=1 Tax=Gonapodya prolifera (strain JEL478) TaxID=1344416 RepID=A0A139A0V8_GONPJ|nr:hypothetical protein M427DRAFT_37533 [Gonapodya prolifera JEL478]|eukprot:KXS10258.1 hypothetical protein M427DRAFT_37533 [Gonapodya prolifera JEL478]
MTYQLPADLLFQGVTFPAHMWSSNIAHATAQLNAAYTQMQEHLQRSCKIHQAVYDETAGAPPLKAILLENLYSVHQISTEHKIMTLPPDFLEPVDPRIAQKDIAQGELGPDFEPAYTVKKILDKCIAGNVVEYQVKY